MGVGGLVQDAACVAVGAVAGLVAARAVAGAGGEADAGGRPPARLAQALEAAGQGHLLAHWGGLSRAERRAFAAQLREIDLGAAKHAFDSAEEVRARTPRGTRQRAGRQRADSGQSGRLGGGRRREPQSWPNHAAGCVRRVETQAATGCRLGLPRAEGGVSLRRSCAPPLRQHARRSGARVATGASEGCWDTAPQRAAARGGARTRGAPPCSGDRTSEQRACVRVSRRRRGASRCSSLVARASG